MNLKILHPLTRGPGSATGNRVAIRCGGGRTASTVAGRLEREEEEEKIMWL